jgi:hypothetical protein
MEMLLGSSQQKVKQVLGSYLKDIYGKIIETEHYIVAEGTIPIALAAHMDTVFESEIDARSVTDQVLYDRQKNIMHCVGFGGFDDKAGIFAIIQILQAGFRPHIILSTDEERGCLGAKILAQLPCPFEDCRYIVQLDRRGTKDCVFYDLDTVQCKEFVDYIEGFGFEEAYGTFTDITEYCPEWGIAGVNLSIGYFNEHTRHETLYVDPMIATITKVKAMLSQSDIPAFTYVEDNTYSRYYGLGSAYGWGGWSNTMTPISTGHNKNSKQTYTCAHCKANNFLASEIFPVVGKNGKTRYYCGDCLVGNVNWCVSCWEAYEIDPKTEQEDPNYICPHCMSVRKERRTNGNSNKTGN